MSRRRLEAERGRRRTRWHTRGRGAGMPRKAYGPWAASAWHRMPRTAWGLPSWLSRIWVRGPPNSSYMLTPVSCTFFVFGACMQAVYAERTPPLLVQLPVLTRWQIRRNGHGSACKHGASDASICPNVRRFWEGVQSRSCAKAAFTLRYLGSCFCCAVNCEHLCLRQGQPCLSC